MGSAGQPESSATFTPDALLAAAYDYLAGRESFARLYDIALSSVWVAGTEAETTFASRLAGEVVLAEAEESSGAHDREETRRRIVEFLKSEALANLHGAPANR